MMHKPETSFTQKLPVDIGSLPELAFVPLDQIYVDSAYQRDVNGNLVSRILKSFNWAKFGAVVLAKQDNGRFAIVEGQHRWTAAKLHPAVTKIPAVIINAGGEAGEAGAFLSINRDRMAVTSIDQFWAGLKANDAGMMAIDAVLKAAGCGVVDDFGTQKIGQTNSVTAMGRAIKNFGDEETIRALKIIRAAWPRDPRAIRGVLVTALARIARANKEPHVDVALAACLGAESFKVLTANAEMIKKLSGGSAEAVLTRAIVELHNKSKRSNLISIGAVS